MTKPTYEKPENDLEFIYAEIKHHLDNVFADETIKAIIQMLKEYPKLREELEQAKKFYDEEFKHRQDLQIKLTKQNKAIEMVKTKRHDIEDVLLKNMGNISNVPELTRIMTLLDSILKELEE